MTPQAGGSGNPDRRLREWLSEERMAVEGFLWVWPSRAAKVGTNRGDPARGLQGPPGDRSEKELWR